MAIAAPPSIVTDPPVVESVASVVLLNLATPVTSRVLLTVDIPDTYNCPVRTAPVLCIFNHSVNVPLLLLLA